MNLEVSSAIFPTLYFSETGSYIATTIDNLSVFLAIKTTTRSSLLLASFSADIWIISVCIVKDHIDNEINKFFEVLHREL